MTVKIDPGHVAAAGAVGGAAAVLIGGIINGWLFHGYQKHTPGTWRKESSLHYVLGSGVLFLTGFTYAMFFALFGSLVLYHLTHWVMVGLVFGIGCWAALALPVILTTAVFVNLHRGSVVGMLLAWLLISVACGLSCARILQW